MQTKSKLRFKIFVLVYSLVLIVSPAVVLAQTPTPQATSNSPEASIRQFLCAPDKEKRGDDFYQCVNKLYRFGLAAGLTAAVLFTVIAGYMYMVGGEGGAKQAKSMISTTLVGVFLLLTTFILLKQINPDLVKFKSIKPQDIKDTVGGNIDTSIVPNFGDTANLPPVNGGGGGQGVKHEADTCRNAGNCTTLGSTGSGGNGVPCASDCQVQNRLAQLLALLVGVAQSNGVSFIVAHGYDAGNHSPNSCHDYGSCADINPEPRNAEGYARLCASITSMRSSGISFQSEDPSSSSFLKTMPACQPFSQSGTADHLHVYLTQ